MLLTWKQEWIWILMVLLTLRLLYSTLGIMAISDGLPGALGADENKFAADAPGHCLVPKDRIQLAHIHICWKASAAIYCCFSRPSRCLA